MQSTSIVLTPNMAEVQTTNWMIFCVQIFKKQIGHYFKNIRLLITERCGERCGETFVMKIG